MIPAKRQMLTKCAASLADCRELTGILAARLSAPEKFLILISDFRPLLYIYCIWLDQKLVCIKDYFYFIIQSYVLKFLINHKY